MNIKKTARVTIKVVSFALSIWLQAVVDTAILNAVHSATRAVFKRK